MLANSVTAATSTVPAMFVPHEQMMTPIRGSPAISSKSSPLNVSDSEASGTITSRTAREAAALPWATESGISFGLSQAPHMYTPGTPVSELTMPGLFDLMKPYSSTSIPSWVNNSEFLDGTIAGHRTTRSYLSCRTSCPLASLCLTKRSPLPAFSIISLGRPFTKLIWYSVSALVRNSSNPLPKARRSLYRMSM